MLKVLMERKAEDVYCIWLRKQARLMTTPGESYTEMLCFPHLSATERKKDIKVVSFLSSFKRTIHNVFWKYVFQ